MTHIKRRKIYISIHSGGQTDEDAAPIKKEEPEEKPEPMEVEDKKTDVKAEPKEEEEGGANSTTSSSSSPLQSRRKSECDAGGRVNCSADFFLPFLSLSGSI